VRENVTASRRPTQFLPRQTKVGLNRQRLWMEAATSPMGKIPFTGSSVGCQAKPTFGRHRLTTSKVTRNYCFSFITYLQLTTRQLMDVYHSDSSTNYRVFH